MGSAMDSSIFLKVLGPLYGGGKVTAEQLLESWSRDGALDAVRGDENSCETPYFWKHF